MAETSHPFSVIIDALKKASSQNVEEMKAGEQLLRNFQTEKSYYSILLRIASDVSLDVSVRWLSMVCLKDGVDRFWDTPNSLEEEEKAFIRQELLNCLDEPIHQLSVQLGAVLGRVCLSECPSGWLLPALLARLSTPRLLGEVVNTLAHAHRKEVEAAEERQRERRWRWREEEEPEEEPAICHSFRKVSALILQPVSAEWERLTEEDPLGHLSQLGMLLQNALHPERSPLVDEYCVLLIKTLHSALDRFPKTGFLSPVAELCTSVCTSQEYSGVCSEGLAIRLLLLTTQALRTDRFRGELFPEDVLARLMNSPIAHRYFVYSEQEWMESQTHPHAFAAEEASQTPEVNSRCCASSFYSALFEMGESGSRRVGNILQRALETEATPPIQKEAAFHLALLCGAKLRREDGAAQWGRLVADQLQNEAAPLLRRRTLQLAALFLEGGFPCCTLLGRGENLLVRVAAAHTLQDIVTSFDFQADQNLAILDPCVSGLFQLLNELQDWELIASVFRVVCAVVGCFERRLRPYEHLFRPLLPPLFAAPHPALQCAVLHCAAKIVDVLGESSVCWHPFVVPLVRASVRCLPLLEEGVALWQRILKHAPSPATPALMDLATLLPTLLLQEDELASHLAELMSAYLLLEPQTFIKVCGLRESICSLVALDRRHISPLQKVVETVFLLFPVEGPVFFEELLALLVDSPPPPPPTTACKWIYCPGGWVLLCRAAYLRMDCLERVVQQDGGWVRLVDSVLSAVQYLFDFDKRKKMVALGLLAILHKHTHAVSCRAESVLSCVANVLEQVADPKVFSYENTETRRLDTLLIRPSDKVPINYSHTNSDCFKTQNCLRKEKVTRLDPIHCVILRDVWCSLKGSFDSLILSEPLRSRLLPFSDPLDTLCEQLTENAAV